MKKMLTFLIIMLIMNIFRAHAAQNHEGPVTNLNYSESGMRYRFEYTYKQAEDGTCTLSRKEGWGDKEGPAHQIPSSVGEDLWKIVKKHGMLAYKSSYTPSGRILDGKMWHLDAQFAKGDYLYTGGENAWPSGDGLEALREYLDNLWKTFPQKVSLMEYRVYGTTMFPTCHFKLELDFPTGKYTLINATNCPASEARSVEVPEAFADEIGRIVAEEKMLDYKRDYEPEYQVLDGESWTLRIRLQNCPGGVYSSGHEAWPDDDGIKRIVELCRKTWAELEKKSVRSPLTD